MKYANGVKATTLTTGTGDVTLASVPGYVPFPQAFSIGDQVPYAIHNSTNWEWGVGTVRAGGVLERTEVASTLVAGVFTSVAPAHITLTGVSEVVCAITAEDWRALNDSLLAHTSDVANPHGVTAAQANADAVGTAASLIAAHESALDPHAGYALEADLGTAAFLDVGTAVGDVVQVQAGQKLPPLDASDLLNLPASGVTDHGALTGLADDDHGQYHTDARGDARYAPIAKGVTNGDSHDHSGGGGAQIAYASLSGTPTLGTAAAAATGDFEAAGTVSTHNAVTTAHGISVWGATLVDDANQATARATLGLGTAATTSSTAYESAGAVSAHAGGTSVHAIASVTGLQGALDAKAPTASPTFTGPVSGITAAMVGAPSGSGNSTGTNTGDETTTTIGALLNGATSKTTPVDADQLGLMDSAAANVLKKLSWANLKTALSSVFVTLAGSTQNIAGKIGLGVSPTAVLHLKAGTAAATTAPLKLTSGTKLTTPEAGAVEFDGTSYTVTYTSGVRRNISSEDFVLATNSNLFTNGYGLLGDNTGMSQYTYDRTDLFAGIGAFSKNVATTGLVGDQRIPIDPNVYYNISLYAKSGDVSGANYNALNRQYFGFAMYDSDNNLILSEHGERLPALSDDTYLASAINPGDTTVTLVSAAGWENASSGLARQFCWYGYANSSGFVYPDFTYTRLTSYNQVNYRTPGAWAAGGISGNVITLTNPWTGPAVASGTAVRCVAGGASYRYSLLVNAAVPNVWTKYSATVGAVQNGAANTLAFRPGTASISILHLINYHGAADNKIRLNGISISTVSAGNLESRIGIGATYKTYPQGSLPADGLAVQGNIGAGTAAPSARIHAIFTTEQLRLGYDAANYYRVTVSSGGIPTHNATGGAQIFNGDIRLDKTITAGGTTGAQTINKPIGSVNFAAAATSLVVTNNLVTTTSLITATVGTNDATMKSVVAVAAAGSFTLHANAAATAETRVNFHVFN
jgi:hypothetical protein